MLLLQIAMIMFLMMLRKKYILVISLDAIRLDISDSISGALA